MYKLYNEKGIYKGYAGHMIKSIFRRRCKVIAKKYKNSVNYVHIGFL
ncbi:hypothetical protein BH10CHL1_BH10CHL1_47760 [soil metagenome]